MKRMIFTALAVALAGPALAQTAPAPTTPDASTAQPAPDATTPPATPPAQTPTDASTTANATGAAPMPADGAYPMCSRSVTDHCTERSTASGARKHSTPRG